MLLAELRCDPLDIGPGTFNTSDTIYGTHVEISCNHGHQIYGQNGTTVTCNSFGRWSDPSVYCQSRIRYLLIMKKYNLLFTKRLKVYYLNEISTAEE